MLFSHFIVKWIKSVLCVSEVNKIYAILHIKILWKI